MQDDAANNGRAPLLQFPSGDRVRVLVDGQASEQTFTLLDCTHVPGPTERHIHTDAHKAVFVLAGHYRFVVGAQAVEAAPGDHVFIPRGVPHHFAVGVDGGRALFTFSPAGAEEYFRGLALIANDDDSPIAVQELRRLHHIEPVEA